MGTVAVWNPESVHVNFPERTPTALCVNVKGAWVHVGAVDTVQSFVGIVANGGCARPAAGVANALSPLNSMSLKLILPVTLKFARESSTWTTVPVDASATN